MSQGYLSIILHAHLPYVRHPEYKHFLEESWLFEAITETYLPLLNTINELVRSGYAPRLTLSLSPTLLSMLKDQLLNERYLRYLEMLIELGDKEIRRTKNDPQVNKLATGYRESLVRSKHDYFDLYKGDLVAAFGAAQQAGALELITCAATHGYLPLLRKEPTAVRAQIAVGVDMYQRAFGRSPLGIWLPECGYYPGLEDILSDYGVRYFILETHGLTHATEAPRHGVLSPIACENGVAAFARDPDSSKQVWSADEGYPGDGDYRDFYRDVGFELGVDYLGPVVIDGSIRTFTGYKYFKVTGKTQEKMPYCAEAARRKAELHASHFLGRKRQQIASIHSQMDVPPIVVAPYDAELFGHWWFEGPLWIKEVIMQSQGGAGGVSLATPGEYLRAHQPKQVTTPSASSWGFKGYNEYWLNTNNDYIWPLVSAATSRMCQLARQYARMPNDPLVVRALNQAARNILLAQASDWPFLIKTGSSVVYAKKRVHDHLARFHYLEESITGGRIDPHELTALEVLDNIFPFIDYKIYI